MNNKKLKAIGLAFMTTLGILSATPAEAQTAQTQPQLTTMRLDPTAKSKNTGGVIASNLNGVGTVTFEMYKDGGLLNFNNYMVSSGMRCNVNGKMTHVSGSTFNLTSNQHSWNKSRVELPYAGEGCQLSVNITPKGSGNHKVVLKPTKVNSTTTNTTKAYSKYSTLNNKGVYEWSSFVVSPTNKSKTVPLSAPSGFNGYVSLQSTSCTTGNGSRDNSTKDANGVQQHICKTEPGFKANSRDSVAKMTLLDDKGVVATKTVTITPNRHHDAVLLKTTRATQGNLKLKVDYVKGAFSVVHATNIAVNGTK